MLSTRFYTVLLFFILVLPSVCSSLLVPKTRRNISLKSFISNAHKERNIDTILILSRSTDSACALKNYNSMDIPIVRLDESTRIRVKEVWNSQILAIVCVRDISDIILLSALAQHLNRMREARIIIWLHCKSSISGDLMGLIIEASKQYNFRNLLVFDTLGRDEKERSITYRLQPFPTPSLQRIENLNNMRPIFPKILLNFYGKTAVILPDLLKSRSFIRNNSKTGKEDLCGSSEKIIIEFAKQRNITLQYHPRFQRHQIIDPLDTFILTMRGEIDLPIRKFAHRRAGILDIVEYLPDFELDDLLTIVPCTEQMCFEDVILYSGLRTYSLIVVGVYIIFAILDTFAVALSNRMFRGKFKISYFSLFFNLRAFCGVLGLPIRLNGHRSSISLRQIVVVMSVLGIILSCLFNVNLSTLLTTNPEGKHIENFEELRASGLEISCEISTKNFIESEVDSNFFQNTITKYTQLSTENRQSLLFSFNKSFGHILFSNTWQYVDAYQKRLNLNTYCTSKALTIVYGVPVGGVMTLNSIFKNTFQEFVQRSNDMGLHMHWTEEAKRQMIVETSTRKVPRNPQELRSLSVEDFSWLWSLMAVCYAVAFSVFVLEICVARWQNKSNKQVILCV